MCLVDIFQKAWKQLFSGWISFMASSENVVPKLISFKFTKMQVSKEINPLTANVRII